MQMKKYFFLSHPCISFYENEREEKLENGKSLSEKPRLFFSLALAFLSLDLSSIFMVAGHFNPGALGKKAKKYYIIL